MFGGGRRRLGVGEQYVQQLLLSEWFGFPQPGRYRIDIRLTNDIVSEAGAKLETATNGVIDLEVGPPDSRILQNLADELAEQILATQNVAQRYAAARMLSYITDPAATEYIRRVLERTDVVDHILIAGLERIVTSDSAALLTQLAASSNESRASWAQEALRRTRARSIK